MFCWGCDGRAGVAQTDKARFCSVGVGGVGFGWRRFVQRVASRGLDRDPGTMVAGGGRQTKAGAFQELRRAVLVVLFGEDPLRFGALAEQLFLRIVGDVLEVESEYWVRVGMRHAATLVRVFTCSLVAAF
jgi:hypothetical protein